MGYGGKNSSYGTPAGGFQSQPQSQPQAQPMSYGPALFGGGAGGMGGKFGPMQWGIQNGFLPQGYNQPLTTQQMTNLQQAGYKFPTLQSQQMPNNPSGGPNLALQTPPQAYAQNPMAGQNGLPAGIGYNPTSGMVNNPAQFGFAPNTPITGALNILGWNPAANAGGG